MKKSLALLVILFFALGLAVPAMAQAPKEVKKEAVPVETKKEMAPKEKIDINTATAMELQELPGIGPKLAEKIVKNRPYKKIDDLVAKKVLGKKKFAKIKDLITVAEAKPVAPVAVEPKKEEKKK